MSKQLPSSKAEELLAAIMGRTHITYEVTNEADEAELTAQAKPTNKDADDEDFELARLDIPNGHRASFVYSPKKYIEHTIAYKAVTDMFGVMDYQSVGDSMRIDVGFLKQQEVVRQGLAIKKEKADLVTVRVATSNETGILSIEIHSYSKKLTQRYAKFFRKLCTDSNFYRGQHLQVTHPQAHPAIKFLVTPETPTVYGFEHEQKVINQNSVGFFSCPSVHPIAPQRGILLYGRPGSGKSLLVRKTKVECLAAGITVLDMDAEAMQQSSYWYDIAEEWLSPALIVMEDFDLIGTSRENTTSAVTTELLSSLNGNKKKRLPIVTIATTNRLTSLDSAVTRSRRMDKILEINKLEHEFRTALFRQKGITVSDSLLNKAAETIGDEATGADVEEISVSCLLYKHLGEKEDNAFNRALKEWEESHKQKTRSMGFNAQD